MALRRSNASVLALLLGLCVCCKAASDNELSEMRQMLEDVQQENADLRRRVSKIEALVGYEDATTDKGGSETKSFASTVMGEVEAAATRRKLSSNSAATRASILYEQGTLKISSDVEIAGNFVANGTMGSKNTPAFLAMSDSSRVQEQNQALPFEVTDLNVGGHYDTSNYRFTAPVKGLYLMFCGVQRMDNGEGARIFFATNGVTGTVGASAWGDIPNHLTAINPMVLNANDYVTCINTDTGIISGKDQDRHGSFFSGVLLSAA